MESNWGFWRTPESRRNCSSMRTVLSERLIAAVSGMVWAVDTATTNQHS